MRKLKLCGWILALAAPLFGQLDDNTLTVTASRTSLLQPDQALFLVNLTADVSASLDDVVAALQGSGITAADLGGVGSLQSAPAAPNSPTLTTWTFSLAVSFSQMNGTLSALAAIQQNLAKAGNGMDMTYYLQGTQISAALQAAQTCPLTALVGSAQSEAQQIAAAAGRKVGPIVGMSDGTSVSGGFISGVIAVARTGDFSQSLSTFLLGSAPSPSCSMTVEFKLL